MTEKGRRLALLLVVRVLRLFRQGGLWRRGCRRWGRVLNRVRIWWQLVHQSGGWYLAEEMPEKRAGPCILRPQLVLVVLAGVGAGVVAMAVEALIAWLVRLGRGVETEAPLSNPKNLAVTQRRFDGTLRGRQCREARTRRLVRGGPGGSPTMRMRQSARWSSLATQ